MTGNGTILIADPDGLWAGSAARILAADGYAVILARSAADLLYQARMRRPDLCLLAPEFAQGGGWELCRRLRRGPQTTGLKIVVLTLEAMRAYRAGADGYLIKNGQLTPSLPPVHAFRLPASGILEQFQTRREALAA